MIADYIKQLLPRWLRPHDGADNELAKFIASIAETIHVARNEVSALRLQGVAATATGLALDAIGEGRNVRRWQGEEDEHYRQRLLATFGTRLRAATPGGMVDMMASFGHPEAEVIEFGLLSPSDYYDGAQLYDGTRSYAGKSRWAEFAIAIDLTPDVMTESIQQWAREIRRAKPAHTRLAYISLYHALADTNLTELASEQIAGASSWQPRHNGTPLYDGDALYGPVVEVFNA